MKAIIQTHAQGSGTETFTIKGKDLDVAQSESECYSIIERVPKRQVLAIFRNVINIQIHGKRKQAKPEARPTADWLEMISKTISETDLSASICDAIMKAEQIADERSQARFAAQANPVATDSDALERFLDSKMTSADCALFGVDVARRERDQYKHRTLHAENLVAELQAKLNQKDELIDELTADKDIPAPSSELELFHQRLVQLQSMLQSCTGKPVPSEYAEGFRTGLQMGIDVMTGDNTHQFVVDASMFTVKTSTDSAGKTYIAGLGVGIESAVPPESVEVHYEPSTKTFYQKEQGRAN